MVTQHTPHPDQVRLEAKAAAILATNPDREMSVESVFGPMEDWIFEIDGDWKLMLTPFSGQWWFFDRVHDDWQDAGYLAGEVVFYVENKLLGTEPVSGPAAATGERPPFCSQCGSPAKAGDRFCRNCGQPVS